MIRWFKSLFAWKVIFRSGVWLYYENTVTGQRKAAWCRGCYGPMRQDWIRDGDIVEGPRGRYIVGTESEIIYG